MIDVSVILCTWNNCARLATTLDALRGCPAPEGVRWELILVNNGSTDDTSAVARRFDERLPLVYVEESRSGLSRAKNAALRVARGRLLVFADDDVIPGRDWLAVYWTAYRDRPAGYYFGGPITSDYEGGRPGEEILRVAGHSITGLDWGPEARALDDGERVYPANWACPAAAVRVAGAFDPELGLDASLGRRRVGETFDLMDRLTALGMSAWYLPEARVVHFVPRAKCSRRFLGHNAEAIGRYSLRAARPHPFVIRRPGLRPLCETPGAMILGVPWRLAARSVMLGGCSMWAWTRGRPGLSEYLLWRFCVGRVKGYRALRRPSKER